MNTQTIDLAIRRLSAFLTITVLLLGRVGVAGSAETELYFTILHTNDEHSALLPSPLVDYHPEEDNPTVGGFARISRLVNDIRAAKSDADEPVLLVSAGDILGGTPFAWLIPDGEAPEISTMRQMGYDVVTIGNHEFDYGPEHLARYYEHTGCPEPDAAPVVVASNLIIPDGHPLADCVVDTHIITLENGLRLGFFGLLGDNAVKLISKMEPVTAADSIASARAAVRALRERDADVLIGVTHAGFYEDRAVAKAVPDIDVLITGHFHQLMWEPPHLEGKTIFAQSSAHGRGLGVLELAYDPAGGEVRIRNEENEQPFLVPVNSGTAEDPDTAAAIAAYTEKLNHLASRLTRGAITDIAAPFLRADFVLTEGPLSSESVLGNFVADAMRLVVEGKTGEKVDFAIQANGVLRGDVTPGTMPHARNKICFYDLATSIGLGTGYDGTPGYPLASIYLTGNELYRMLELSLFLSQIAQVFYLQLSGGRFTYDPDRLTLFQIPFAEFPFPSFRAVRSLERFTGEGVQDAADADYAAISRRDDTLYHVVCDYYILSFFPRVAALLPIYKVIPKDRYGNEISIRDAIIYVDGDELKFWQVALEYALSQPPDTDGIPRIPDYYGHTGARIMRQSAHPLLMWPLLALMLLF